MLGMVYWSTGGSLQMMFVELTCAVSVWGLVYCRCVIGGVFIALLQHGCSSRLKRRTCTVCTCVDGMMDIVTLFFYICGQIGRDYRTS